ncbi:hypothetical protein CSV80_00900 [Sporosarcina sp. P12(2017)]|uniref:phage tail-collar fiber domain-containing protein n=1 Tax=unclassified Sporosarcina TaxID=2647733 RepID=UPI000C16B7E2|nr:MULTISPECIES: phage tail protein [unclassified Sporosarcina]PIC59114.1 hypothetical protein CSV81_00900 [Sporosarcina sp. P10]PIC62435.1 hypothetical protein CSV80_00900 [Sporosarcina sp. P12(2017)]
MSSNSTTLIQARSHLAQAHAGDVSLRPITGMVFGDGGVDETGSPVPPDAAKNRLNSELYRKGVDSHSYPSPTSVTFTCTLTEEELNDKELSEVGLVDSGGNIVAVKAFKKKHKDNETEITFEWTEKF